MRKLFTYVLTLFTAVTISTSCGVNGEDADVYTSIATVVEGTSSIPYYVVLDDGKEAYVTNTSEWSPSFSEKQTELRYIIAYEIVNERSSIFDMEIKLIQVTPIATQSGGLYIATAEDFTDEGTLKLHTYDSGASVDVCFISPARDYITLMIQFLGTYTNASPKMKLVLNNPANSPHKDLYTEGDGYLYLELYHDNTEYMGEQEMTTYWSCKMPDVDTIINQYSGVKIIAKNHNTERYEVYKFNFATEEQK